MVPAFSPLGDCAWLVTRLGSRVVIDPYEVVVPYSTCEVPTALVVQLIAAPLVVMPLAVTLEIVSVYPPAASVVK